MSDTQSKIDKRKEEARKRQKKNRKQESAKLKPSTKQKIKITAVSVVVVLLLAALILPSAGFTKRMLTALTIGNTKISTAEYSYYYRASFNNYYKTMASYMGEDKVPINLSRSLEKQEMADGKTYADYFSENAVNQLRRLVLLSEEANQAGFTLPQEAQENLDVLLKNIEEAARKAGVSIDKYLSNTYGTGFDLDTFKKCIERELLAQAYEEHKTAEFGYEAEQINAYYEGHARELDVADFRMESFYTADSTEDAETATEEQAKAESEATAFLDKVTDEASFAEASLARAKEKAEEGQEVKDSSLAKGVGYNSTAQLDANLANWVFGEEVKAGDKAVIKSANGKTFYAVYMVNPAKRVETPSVNVRHILVNVSDMNDAEAKKAGEDKAKDLLEQWKQNGGTEEAFTQLATDHSDDSGSRENGGLYENVIPGQMVINFNNWCFDAARKSGDTGIVESSYGYHVMYYVGQSTPSWQVQAEKALRDNDYNEFYKEAEAKYEVKTHWLGIAMRNKPI